MSVNGALQVKYQQDTAERHCVGPLVCLLSEAGRGGLIREGREVVHFSVGGGILTIRDNN